MPRYYLPKVNKYVTFAASLPIALSGGLSYLFSLWSPALKAAYALDQEQLQVIAAAGNLGGYSSFISGLVYDALEHRHHVGPRLSLALGCTSTFLGFFGLWAAVTRRFVASTWQLALLAAIAGNGGTWFDTVTLATNLRNFPAQRGPVVGVIKAGVGLSASLYAAAYMGAFQPDVPRFLLFLAIVPPGVGLAALPLVNYVPWTQSSELEGGHRVFSPQGRFLLAFQAVATLALYLMATALAAALETASPGARGAMALGAALLLTPFALIPLGSGGIFATKAEVVVRAPTDLTEEVEEVEGDDDALEETLLLEGGDSEASRAHDNQERASSPPPPGVPPPAIMPSYSVAQSVRLLDFWLLALICGIGVGCGLALLNNAAQLVVALGGPPEARAVVVTLFGVASCCGRLLFGALPERALHSHGVPRPAWLVGAGVFTAGTCAALAYATMPWLYALAGCAGLAFGAHWSLLPSLSSELFGLDSFASIYTLLQLAPAAGNYAMGAGLMGSAYEAAGRRHGDPEGTCIGGDCFRPALLVMASLAAVAGVLAVWLTARTVRLYRDEARALRSFDTEAEGEVE